jgi:exosortase A
MAASSTVSRAAAAPVRVARPWQRALAALGAAWLAILLAYWPSWASMVQVWWQTTTFHHGFLIAPIAAALVWRLRPELARLAPTPEPLGLVALAGCAAAWLLGHAGDVQLLQHLAVVGMLVGAALTLLGRQVTRVIAFPLAFLFLMVPFGEGIVPWLQDFTAHFAVALLRLVGVPVFHDGVLIETPSGLFEVAEACAGIRFLIANLVVAVLFAHLALRKPWKWVLFLALGVVVPIVANGLRAFAIVYIAYLTDNAYAAGVDHLVYGWGFFTAVMLVLLLLGRAIADPPAEPASPAIPGPAGATVSWRPGLAALVLAAILAPPAYAALAMRLPEAASVAPLPPPTIPGWRATSEGEASGWRPQVIGADHTTRASYRSDAGGNAVELFVGFFAFQRQGAEAVHHGHRLAEGQGWLRTGGGRMSLTGPDLPPEARFERLAGTDRVGQRLVLWWYWVDGTFTTDPIRAKMVQVRDRLLGRSGPAALVAIAVDTPPTAPEGGTAVATGFLAAAGPALQNYLAALGAGSR